MKRINKWTTKCHNIRMTGKKFHLQGWTTLQHHIQSNFQSKKSVREKWVHVDARPFWSGRHLWGIHALSEAWQTMSCWFWCLYCNYSTKWMVKMNRIRLKSIFYTISVPYGHKGFSLELTEVRRQGGSGKCPNLWNMNKNVAVFWCCWLVVSFHLIFCLLWLKWPRN